jgi:hypothetical protein
MVFETIDSPKGQLSRCSLDAGSRIARASDFLDVLVNCPTDTLALGREALSEDFFNLRTGLAGECLQKVSNYRKRLIVVGDFPETESRSLRDFILESNRTGKVLFTADLESAIRLLK